MTLFQFATILGMKFSRRLLTCFWDSFLYVFSQGIVDETDNRNQSISLALEGLQCAAKLSNILGEKYLTYFIIVTNFMINEIVKKLLSITKVVFILILMILNFRFAGSQWDNIFFIGFSCMRISSRWKRFI